LTIADTGSGIHPEIRKTLFEPFVSTKGDTGTGLGLWVSSEIVERHGGTIQVKSTARTPNTGTAFSVFLPFQHQTGVHRSFSERMNQDHPNQEGILSGSKSRTAALARPEMTTLIVR
jgi:hypothetical protein